MAPKGRPAPQNMSQRQTLKNSRQVTIKFDLDPAVGLALGGNFEPGKPTSPKMTGHYTQSSPKSTEVWATGFPGKPPIKTDTVLFLGEDTEKGPEIWGSEPDCGHFWQTLGCHRALVWKPGSERARTAASLGGPSPAQ